MNGQSADLPTGRLQQRLNYLSVALGCCAFVVGFVALCGWAFNVQRLTDWNGSGVSMFPNTALCGMLAGAALVLTASRTDAMVSVIRAIAIIVGTVGILTLLEHVTGVNFGIDTLLFNAKWGQEAATAPNRMGPPAAVSYSLIGIGLMLATLGPRARRWANALGICVAAIASLSLVGYWYGADNLYQIARLTGIAMQTSILLFAAGIALSLSIRERGIAALLTRDDPGGEVVRRLLLPLIAATLLLGKLRLIGEQAGWFDPAFGTALRTLAIIGLFVGLLWWTAQRISRQSAARRAAERSLRESEARHRALIESSAYGVLTIDRRGTIMSANPAAERLFGFSASEMNGKNVIMLMPEPYKGEHDSYLANYLSSGERKIIGIGREVAGRRKDGSTFPMDLAVAEFRVGEERYFTGIVHDISERKRAEQALRDSEAALRSLNERLEAKVGERTAELAKTYAAYQEEAELRVREERQRIALLRRLVKGQEAERERIGRDIHDHLGQRLTAFRLQLESLKQEMNEDPAGKSARFRLETLEELARILDAEVSYLAWELRPTVLDQFGLTETLRIFVQEWSKQCGVAAEFQPVKMSNVVFDKDTETHIYRITQEALNNIAKHAKASHVSVQLSNTNGAVSLIIEDDGQGFTVDGKATRKKQLGGLGLTGMRERAHLIGGRFEIDSEKGKGTTIFVRLNAKGTLKENGQQVAAFGLGNERQRKNLDLTSAKE